MGKQHDGVLFGGMTSYLLTKIVQLSFILTIPIYFTLICFVVCEEHC